MVHSANEHNKMILHSAGPAGARRAAAAPAPPADPTDLIN